MIVPTPSSNKPPVAIAFYDSLNNQPPGSKFVSAKYSSDPDGSIVAYKWRKVAGPVPCVITDSTNFQTVISNLVQGTYQIELTVTDNGGLSAKDTAVITVTLPVSTPTLVADAGPDQTITLPLDSTYLDGRLSSPNGFTAPSPTNFYWTTIAGPTQYVLTPPNLPIAGLARTTAVSRGMVPGVYVFTLRIISAAGSSNTDTVKVTVLDDPQNRNTVTYHNLEWTEGDPYSLAQLSTFISSSIRPDIISASGNIKPIEISLKLDPSSAFIVVPFKTGSGYTWDAWPYVAWIYTVPNNPLLVGRRSDLRVKFL